MNLQFIKDYKGAEIYKGSGRYYWYDDMDENHCPNLSNGCASIEEVERAIDNHLEASIT